MKLVTQQNIVVLMIVLLFNQKVLSQDNLRNQNWVIGMSPMVNFSFQGNLSINNSMGSLPGGFDNSCISDVDGNFLFVDIGFGIFDKSGLLIDNSKDINCPYGDSLAKFLSHMARTPQTSIILPKKGQEYYVISTGMSDSVASDLIENANYQGYDVLNYSVVDMNLNNGLGGVTTKNKVLLDKQQYANTALTAVRHGNGKDWWLVKADCWKHQYQTFLVQEDTILGPYYYTYPDTVNYWTYYSEIHFSDDGSKMASNIQVQTSQPLSTSYALYNRLDVFDFDRCNGTFSNQHFYVIPNDTTSYPWEDGLVGLCFSPNSKLLYGINTYNIYQIDLSDTNRYNAIHIHGPDDSLNVFPSYHSGKCGPDGKLYIGNFDGTRNAMSYINDPNERGGAACNFVPKGIVQPYNNNLLNPPNMPNYGLGWLPGCAPASVPLTPLQAASFSIYPNPASNYIQLRYSSTTTGQFVLFDLLGHKVLEQVLHANEIETTVNVQHLPFGLYTYKVNTLNNEHLVGKITLN